MINSTETLQSKLKPSLLLVLNKVCSYLVKRTDNILHDILPKLIKSLKFLSYILYQFGQLSILCAFLLSNPLTTKNLSTTLKGNIRKIKQNIINYDCISSEICPSSLYTSRRRLLYCTSSSIMFMRVCAKAAPISITVFHFDNGARIELDDSYCNCKRHSIQFT